MLSIFITLLLAGISDAQLKFYAIGDWGVDNQNQVAVAAAMSQHAQANGPIDFIIATGDNFYPDGVWAADDEQFEIKWRQMYNLPGIRDLVWYITVGNHDHGGAGNEWFQVDFGQNEQRWYFPHLWYNFTASGGNSSTHFIAVDTQSMRQNTNDRPAQYDFINQQLTNSNADWKIVFGHHPPYTSGRHFPGSSTLRNNVVPVMEQVNADIFLLGHDHNLEHLVKPYGSSGRHIDYLISGGGGRGLYAQTILGPEYLEETYGVRSLQHFESFGFMYFQIDSNSIRADFIDQNNRVLYQVVRNRN